MVATVVIIIGPVTFAAGVVTAFTLLVSWGIRREERHFSLTRQAPGRVSAGARRLTGLYVRQPADPGPVISRETDIYA